MGSASYTLNNTPPDFVAVAIDNIPLEISLPFPLFVLVAGKHVKFREISDTLSTARVKTLGEKADAVFIPRDSWADFLKYMENFCDVEVKDPEQAARNVRTLLMIYTQHLEQETLFHRATVGRLRVLAYRLATLIHEYPKVSQKLLQKYKDHSVYFCAHNVNVAVYSVAMGKKLGLSLEDLKLLAFSCLVHNVGNLLVPREVLYKEGELTTEEMSKVRAHSITGSQLLEYMDCPTEVVLTAKQHHERVDGGGYPYGLWGAEIHIFAKICAIADVYDALTSNRPGGKAPLAPKAAVEAMQQMKGQFDPNILSQFGNA